MKTFASRRFVPLFVVQFIGAFCDNVFKNAFVLLATFGLAQVHGWNPNSTVNLIAGLFILPFALVSGWAGYVSDIWTRHTLIRRLKTFELGVMAWAAWSLHENSFYGMWAVIVCLGFISALFGPLKYGLLPVYLAESELVTGNAWFEGGSFLAIVTGTLVGAYAAHGRIGRDEVAIVLVALGAIGCVVSYLLPEAPAAAQPTESPWNPRTLWTSTVDAIGTAHRIPVLWRSVLGVSWFWCLGAVLLSLLPTYVKETLHGGADAVTRFLLCFALGIGAGSFLGLKLTHGRIRATYVPVAGLAMSVFLVLWIAADRWAGSHLAAMLNIVTAGIGVAGGIYSVPLYSLMQHRSPVEHRGRVISANNIMNAAFMVAGAIGAIAIGEINRRPATLLAVLALANLAVAIYMVWLVPESVIQTAVRFLLRLLYRVEVRGVENYRESGRRLIIANHTSWLDGALLAAFLPETPTFALSVGVARLSWIRPFLKWIRSYPIGTARPLALKTLCTLVEREVPVAIFPEGRLSTTGGLMKVYEGPGFIAQRTGAEVIPVHIEGAHLSLFTRLGRKYRRQCFPKIVLTIGRPQTVPAGGPRSLRSTRISEMLVQSASLARIPPHSVFRELIEASRRFAGGRSVLVSPEGRELGYKAILSRAAYLGHRFERELPSAGSVGILLPTSLEATLAFLGVQYIHRVAAWLNFSMGPAAFASTLRTAEVHSVITSRRFVEIGRLAKLVAILNELGIRILWLEDIKPTGRNRLLAAAVGANAVRGYARREKGWRAAGADPRCAILFTSGSSGLPKAVVLSHRNLLANVAQLRARIDFTPSDCVFNALPLFHAFGFTGGMLTPLLSGVRSLLYPTPLHYGVIPELIYQSNATIFFATNSFLNGYARKAHPYDFYSLRYVFAGAEKLQPATQKLWSERFGLRLFEGYGTTEASPALAMNTPLSFRPGTVGRFLPGVEYRLEPMPGTGGGRLFFRGPNRMMGYYLPDDPGRLVETGDWYDTGDIASIDDEGFVTLLGRAKRFAKIAGEMVSLAAVEEAVASVAEGAVAVVSRPHSTKGEELIACAADGKLTLERIRSVVRERGLSDLSVPKRLKVVSPFPLLGSGKPDLKTLEVLAST
ncbi:MAG TPA: MFS transporter [Opitutaceae bacterium]|jgi:acyl-[acyl-carrier-protein]-phospholipid O-acyltransferase/long-chain-fatty-acid--[acyl-carrier-protein] ligase